MDWSKLGNYVADAAPVLGTALGGPAGAAVGGIIASVFGTKNDPDAIEAAIKADPEAAAKLMQIQNTHEEALAKLNIENETTRLVETQVTMREEIKSEDAFVRRARPMFLYVVAFSISVEVVIAFVVALWRPEQIANLAVLYGALATPQSIAAAMCGVYMKTRSDDKAISAGMKGPSLIESMFGKRAA